MLEPKRFCGFRDVSVDERFFSKVHMTSDCWEWIANKTWGYGYFYYRGRQVRTHRFAYEMLVGPIPDGFTIDHLCKNPACVNPDHLEAVTMRVNALRSTSPTAKNAEKTHCKRGHPFDEDNTRWGRTPNGLGRTCRTCHRQRVVAAGKTPEALAKKREKYRLKKESKAS